MNYLSKKFENCLHGVAHHVESQFKVSPQVANAQAMNEDKKSHVQL